MNSDVVLDGKKLLEELKWRGLVFQTTDEAALEEALSSASLKYYCGFDPTAPSLHHGNLVQLILLRHLQNAGHQPFCIIGGATGLIGDPRQSGERVLNDKETVAIWGENLGEQFKKFLKFDGENAAQIVNNYSWTEDLSAIDFLRDIGKHFRMGTMLAKDTVKTRLEGDGLSFTEFSYQVLQGYDFYTLHKNYGVTMQTGGQDQWGNLTAGLDLIHKIEGAEVHVMTTPLITKNDGTKFGKSEGGAIWLDPKMMSPYSFYQFWLNIEDDEVIKLLKVFTFLEREEIERLEREVAENPGAREAQKALAREVTVFVHGENALNQALSASGALFGQGELSEIDAGTLENALEGVALIDAQVGDRISDQFIALKLANGFGDYKKTLAQGGYYVNNEKVTAIDQLITSSYVLSGGYVILRKGKKNISAVKIGEGGK